MKEVKELYKIIKKENRKIKKRVIENKKNKANKVWWIKRKRKELSKHSMK